MTKRTISARISEQDFELLNAITRDGAVTVSDKLRVLIELVREMGKDSFTHSFLAAHETIGPIKAAYLAQSERSEDIEAVFDFMVEAAAVLQGIKSFEPTTVTELESQLKPAIESLRSKTNK